MHVTRRNNGEPDRPTSNGNNHQMGDGAAGENPTKAGAAALWVSGFGLCRTSMRINHQAAAQDDSRCACLSIKHTF